MNNSTSYQSPLEDGSHDLAESILHDIIYRAVIFGRVSPSVPVNEAIRLIDQAGAAPTKARELLVSAYPNLFRPAYQAKESQHE